MAGTVTLSTLVEQIRDRAKMKNSVFVTDLEITSLINNSIASLYDLIIQHRGEEYFEEETSVSLVSGTTEYDLPNDFYKLVAVMDNNSLPLEMFDRRDADHKYGQLKYRISNNKFHVNRSQSASTLTIYYVPLSPELVEDADTADFHNGWEDYVVTDCAKTLLEEEESDATHLERKLTRLEKRIEQSVPKDIHRPTKIVDVEGYYYNADREIYKA